MSQYRCMHCEATFEHPNVEECATVGGHCALLVCAGWKPVWVHVALDNGADTERHIFSRGGWICPECAGKFAPPRPPHKRRERRRDHRNSDRELS